MTDFKELMDYVKEKGYGSSEFTSVNGDMVYLSRGIKAIFLENEVEEQKIIEAVERFQKSDFGNAAEHGKASRPGHEYGRYEITNFADSEEDSAVWIHRVEGAIKVFFKFER